MATTNHPPQSSHLSGVPLPTSSCPTISDDHQAEKEHLEHNNKGTIRHTYIPLSTCRILTPCTTFTAWFKEKMHSLCSWIQHQLACNDNRYAFQMGVAYIVATLFVVVPAISKVTPNSFWIGKKSTPYMVIDHI